MASRIISALARPGLAVMLPTSVFAAGGVQRFALVAAANDGGPDRRCSTRSPTPSASPA
jgi:hypothetical protein